MGDRSSILRMEEALLNFSEPSDLEDQLVDNGSR
jgi:hypothetical protein